MADHRLPAAYRWFVAKGTTDWTPWHFEDDAQSIQKLPDFERARYFQDQFRTETGADFDVYLFARRQDREDFAFFVCAPDGVIEDSTITLHLTFSGRFEFYKGALVRPTGAEIISTMKWLQTIAMEDMGEWIEDWATHGEID